ncbi:AmmeMemoRadiSam system radical SAM enzyme [candidate division KSB1 bacterium]|nr:AmmeMemoRadiSam system radical SAM enzyme [candidate division KSB1 bacterium]
MQEAYLYDKLENGRVRCQTCAHHCSLASGQTGICGVRKNQEGKLYSLVYRQVAAMHSDPIEKKPLFHFLPGSRSFSIATVGCNMRCRNCQNSDISQMPIDQNRITGNDMVPEMVIKSAKDHACKTISYTYTEPAVYWDYAFDTAKLAREAGLRNIFVTNGYWSEKSLKTMLPYMDGVNVDLKFFDDRLYRTICGARLQPVLDTIQALYEAGVWLEVTTLLIPDLNDSGESLRSIAKFIRKISPRIPWHISRFYPIYRMTDRSLTSAESIQRAREIGIQEGLYHVYSGNLPGEDGESTFCPQCGETMIGRMGFSVQSQAMHDGKCPHCGEEISGVWE